MCLSANGMNHAFALQAKAYHSFTEPGTPAAILTSKFESDLNLFVWIHFHSANCASKILNPVGDPARRDGRLS